MTNHPVTNHEVQSDDAYESLARRAGEAVRRPAPHDGLERVRTVHRRHQRVRLAAGSVALAAAVGVGAAIVLHDEPASISTRPEVTTPESVTSLTATEPMPTQPSATAAPAGVVTAPPYEPVVPDELAALLSPDLTAWREQQEARGYTNLLIESGKGTTARLVTTIDPSRPWPEDNWEDNTESAVLLDDGRLVEPPDGTHVSGPYSLGGRPALLDYGPDWSAVPLSVWVLDPATGAWTSSGDLGLGDVGAGRPDIYVTVVGDVMLVTVHDLRGVIVNSDLSITPMTPPPDGVPLHLGSTAGGKVMVFFPHPWAYDPSTDTWSEIALPDWFECSDPTACDWARPSDFRTLELVTDRGVLMAIPDGSVGLYDPSSDSWIRLDPPFVISGLWSATALGDRVVFGNGEDPEAGFGVLGVLDLSTGTWTTTRVQFTGKAQTVVEWGAPYWDLRPAGSWVIAAPGGTRYGGTVEPFTVYDTASDEWFAPSADVLAAWALLATVVPTY